MGSLDHISPRTGMRKLKDLSPDCSVIDSLRVARIPLGKVLIRKPFVLKARPNES